MTRALPAMRGLRRRALLASAMVLACAACAPPAPETIALAPSEPLPEWLSEIGALRRDAGQLQPTGGIAYSLGHPLFSDYAAKYRTVHLPPGTRAQGLDAASRTLRFPVGTLITKTFYYPLATAGSRQVRLEAPQPFAGAEAALETGAVRLLETRVLRHGPQGWDAVSYLWNEAGTDARRARAGALLTLESDAGSSFDYLVPDANQCGGCHATNHESGALEPIGPKPANLAAVAVGAADQIADWQARGMVAGGVVAPWPSQGAGAARAYLDANCAHCHSDVGAADTAGIDLSVDASLAQVGVCKSPVAAGRGSGGRAYDVWPGEPDASILLYRLAHRDPGAMMPELGRTLVHDEGVARVRAWITSLEGTCDAGSLL